MSCLVYLYAGGLLVNVLDLKSANALSVTTVAQAAVWPVYAVGQLYELVAPAVAAVVGYVVDIVNTARGK
jgi:hypothetical protein